MYNMMEALNTKPFGFQWDYKDPFLHSSLTGVSSGVRV